MREILTAMIFLLLLGCKIPSDSQVRNIDAESQPNVPGSLCDQGFIPASKNAEVKAYEDFCVMKYEAKIRGIEDGTVDSYNAKYRAESRASGTPWVNINRDEAIEACSNIGASLISNSQWQAIARNIESVSTNWSGGRVGEGSLNRGHSNGSSSLAASAPEQAGASKRTHSLDNGAIIWDLAGNVFEWVKDDIKTNEGGNGPVTQEPWTEDAGKLKWGPKGSYKNLNSGEYGGLGQSWLLFSGGAVLRGGVWANSDSAGVFTTDLASTPSGSINNIGFRCVRPLALTNQ